MKGRKLGVEMASAALQKRLACCCLLGISFLFPDMGVAAEARRPMALIVMWDGARADVVENVELPNLRRLMDGAWQAGYRGAWSLCARPIPDARPYSFSNHASILSGVTAAKHSVFFNHRADRCRAKEWPTWLSRVKDRFPKTSVEYVYGCGPYNAVLCADPCVIQKNIPSDEAKGNYVASRLAAADAPCAMAVMMSGPDGGGHRTGFYPYGEEYEKALRVNDAALGRMLAAIARRPSFAEEDWLVCVTSDHGGNARMHGLEDAHNRTIPLVLAGRHVVSGQLAGSPMNCDVPVTALSHFGIATENLLLDGRVVGTKAASWRAATHLGDGLAYYFPFQRPGRDVVNVVAGNALMTLVGDEEYLDPARAKDGWFPGFHLRIAGAENSPCAVRLDGSEKLFQRAHPSFALTFWGRLWTHGGDPVVLGNKDLSTPCSPGFALTECAKTERTEKGLGLRLVGDRGEDTVIGTYAIENGTWGFYAIVFTPDGQVWFYQGRTDGRLHWMCAPVSAKALKSPLPIHLGQDGTGCTRWNFSDFLDDVAVWSRPLALTEVSSIFRSGREKRRLADIVRLTN